MELEEHRNQNGYDSIQHECDLNHNFGKEYCLRSILRSKVIGIQRPLDTLKPGERHSDYNEVGEYQHVDQQQDEELSIPEADTVVDPRAVVVHVEHASIA